MPPLLRPKIQKKTIQVLVVLGIATLLSRVVSSPMARASDNIGFPMAIQQSRFIGYTPRSFSIREGKVQPGSRAGIRRDLEILRPYFNGLITYSATNGVEGVAEVASELNYQAVIMGIWDPSSEIEINNVLQAFNKHPELITAVIVGNEGIYTKRYTPEVVQQTIKQIKKAAPRLAVTTSEPFFLYLEPDYSDFFGSHDLLMPNIHPVFEKWFNPKELEHGVSMVLNVVAKLQTTYRLPILIKETGLPSGKNTQGYSPTRQAQFWHELNTRFQSSPTLAFAYFEAFDTPWKPALIAAEFPGDHDNEAYWGLFTTTGQAKEVISRIPRLTRGAHTNPIPVPQQAPSQRNPR